MEDKREEDFDKEFDDEELDLTKDAFFADMVEMEEEIASDAYELVEHAINLINSQYYDDGIEILRQAIGLYTQINREDEIKAINEKISEIYILKEKAFREVEIEAEKEVKVTEVIEEAEVVEEVITIKEEGLLEETKNEADLISRADQLIVEAHQLANINRFEEALDRYDEAEKILKELGKSDEIERIYSLIEDCYNKKAEYLRSIKKEEQKELVIGEESELSLSEEQLKEEKLKQYLETKKREEEISSRAYEILDKAVELAKLRDYDQALSLYKEGANLFKELNWTYEAKKIQDTIEQLEKEKVVHFQALEKEKVQFEQKIETEIQKEKVIDQYVKEIEEQEKIAQMERVRGLEFQKMEQEFFKAQIDNMVTEAARMAREYELAMQKALKDGKLVEECIYPKVIEIYKRIKDLLIDKGWKSEAVIYDNTINVYIQKFEQDQKIRQIEAEKIKKRKETEEIIKFKKEDVEVGFSEEQLIAIEKQRQREIEIQNIRNEIEEMTKRADRLGREYEVALRKGKFELKCPYPEIINIYERAKLMAQERGWNTEVTIFLSQINTFKEKLEKDKRLRQIEAEKAKKQEEVEELFKIKKEEPSVGLDADKLKLLEEQKRLEEEKEDFEEVIDIMIKRAEKMAREYDVAMKKAIKQGELAENPPFLKIISIYERVRRMLLEKGRNEETVAYGNQISFYNQKLEKDNKLREIEVQKAQREKKFEELQKIGKKEIKPAKPEKIKELEAEDKEEDILLDKAMNLIDETEKAVKRYELSIKKDILVYESPYDKAVSNYEVARNLFKKIGWNDEANRLIKTIKFYKDKKEKDDKLRAIEQKKLEKPEIELEPVKIDIEKEFLERQKRLTEFEEKQKQADETTVGIFNMIQDAEKMAQEYELKLKSGVFDYEAPYEKIINIYRDARKCFEEINWKEESAKLIDTIKFYREKLAQDKKIRAFEAEKAKKREEELMMQQRLLEQARQDQEKLLQKRKETLHLKKERIAQFETQKDKAFRLMDQAKRELRQNNFDKAIESYKESEKIFIDIKWKEGIKMVRDSVVMISNKKKAYELEQKALEESKVEKILIEEKLEEKLAEAQLIKKRQQEEKRKEFLKIQREKEQERQISEEAYELLEEGTALMDRGKFTEAYEKFTAARELFQKISWQREVSRINNELLFKLKREQKQTEIFEDIKIKKVEEEKQIALLKEEAKRERKELEKRRKVERKEEAKRELDRKISIKLDKANKLIDSYRYNEGILIMREEIKRLMKLEKHDEIEKINEQINNLKAEAEIPLITLEVDDEESQSGNFKAAYKALDEAQVSAADNRFMKAISELSEAKFKLKELKLGKKIIEEIDKKITEFRSKVSKKPLTEVTKAREETIEDEMEILRRRIAARREERRKKVLDLLGKRE